VFDLYGTDRLTEWKKFRCALETDPEPLVRVIELWARAPLVNRYLDQTDPESWPDPWRLILDGKFDDIAICLGMLYTLQLTDRFSRENFKIYTIKNLDANTGFCVSVADRWFLNLHYGQISDIKEFHRHETNMLYERNRQQ
jgi:hypothetical protein